MTRHYEPLLGPCGKRIYPSPSIAKKLARRINSGRRSTVGHYHCMKCHGWHLGNSAGGSIRRRRA